MTDRVFSQAKNIVSVSGGKDSTAETWLPIVGYEGLYEVSSFGRVRSVDRVITYRGGQKRLKGKILKMTPNKAGYLGVALSSGGKPVTRMVHRLVAETFVPGRSAGKEVNHIDGVKLINTPENLEWVTRGENNSHRYRALNHSPVRSWAGKSGADHNKSKAVIGIPVDGGEELRFGSTREAGRNGFTQTTVAACCRGEKTSHRGYRWFYMSDMGGEL